MLQDGCLGVVDKYFGWDTAKRTEGKTAACVEREVLFLALLFP
jgi:hypothetical protein